MSEKHILVTGRPASGQTEIIVAITNRYPETTLLLSQQNSPEYLIKARGLDKNVKVVTAEEFMHENLSKYQTICIDCLEMLPTETIVRIMELVQEDRMRIILVSYVLRCNNEVLDRLKIALARKNGSLGSTKR